ncbi:MAG: 2-oxoacid:acceptor oxidoreductase family protein [Deltaproteobacteria bacterium]|nr:2-oxoacid:acceptor oxidoreductase family protein [Deltaproteobacteria bacterium]
MTDCKLLIAGQGGQGVVFLSRLLSQTALMAGDDFITYESHGMAMRGGSVTSQVKIGNYRSPLIGEKSADLLLVLAADEFQRNRHFVRPGGISLVNSPHSLADLPSENFCGATAVALEHKLAKAVNLVFCGWAAQHPAFPYNFAQIREAIKLMAVSPDIETANLRALEIGRQLSIR